MKINKIISQIRRDFYAEYICEHCNNLVFRNGYDDEHFHNNVIPHMECPKCKKSSPDDYRPLTTKYKSWEVV